MLYLWLKLIHIISATILFGTGIGTACTMWYAHHTRNIEVIAATTRYVVLADWIFTTPSGLIQPITGLWMVFLAGYSLKSAWLLFSIMGYLIAACCWFPVVVLQIKMRNLAAIALKNKSNSLSPHYFCYFNTWFYLGWPAFISLIIVFYLMTVKP